MWWCWGPPPDLVVWPIPHCGGGDCGCGGCVVLPPILPPILPLALLTLSSSLLQSWGCTCMRPIPSGGGGGGCGCGGGGVLLPILPPILHPFLLILVAVEVVLVVSVVSSSSPRAWEHWVWTRLPECWKGRKEPSQKISQKFVVRIHICCHSNSKTCQTCDWENCKINRQFVT